MSIKIITEKKVSEKFVIKNLKECLNYIGYTQAQLAKELKLSRAYISDIASGRRFCNQKIFDFLENTPKRKKGES